MTSNLPPEKNIHLITNTGLYWLNLPTKLWSQYHKFDINKSECFATAASATANGIYISGGNQDHPQFQYFHESILHNQVCMLENRFCHQSVELNGSVYCCGGQENRGTIELYNTAMESWSMGPTMIQKKYDFGITKDENNCILAFGGWNGDYISGIIEQLDTREGVWNCIGESVEVSAAVRLGDSVYCIDQIHGGSIFDLRMRKWCGSVANVKERTKPIVYFACCFDIVELEGRIYGVFQSKDPCTWSTFLYDHHINKWNDLEIELRLPEESDIRLCTLNGD